MSRLYIFCGLPFSGKTTLSKKIAQQFGYTRIDLDEVKFQLFGHDIRDTDIDQNGWDKVYHEMYRQIEEHLEYGETVLQDAGNFTLSERNIVRDLAEKRGIKAITVFIDVPTEVAQERLLKNRETRERFDVSDEDFASTVQEMEPPSIEEKSITFHYTDDVEVFISNFSDLQTPELPAQVL